MPKELQKNQEQDTQLRLSSRSVRNVRFAQEITGVGNTGAVVNAMIDLGADIVRALHQGSRIFYDYPDGKRVQLRIVGCVAPD